MARRRQALGRLALVAGGALVYGCSPSQPPEGTLGEERRVYFQAIDGAVFAERLAVGSRFVVELEARREEDAEVVAQASLLSSDVEVAFVTRVDGPDEDDAEDDFQVELRGPGEARLQVVREGEAIDALEVRAARAGRVELLDGKILGSSVDARVPGAFALAEDNETLLALSAVDRCGGPLLVLDAVDITSSDEGVLRVSSEDGIAYDVEALAAGEVELTLAPAAGEPVTFEVTVVPPDLIDDVEVAIAAAQDNRAELWGRAFVEDLEVIGLDYAWDATPRVSLNRDRGPNVIATIAFPAEGQPADERPAIVEAELYGEEGSLELLSAQTTDLVTSRVPPPEEEVAAPGPSCGSPPCDPYAAALVGVLGLSGLRRRARRRGPRQGSDD